jgi:hypothetical protein
LAQGGNPDYCKVERNLKWFLVAYMRKIWDRTWRDTAFVHSVDCGFSGSFLRPDGVKNHISVNTNIPGKLAEHPAVSPCPGQKSEIFANFR